MVCKGESTKIGSPLGKRAEKGVEGVAQQRPRLFG